MRTMLSIILAFVLVGCASLTDLKDFTLRDAKVAQQWAIDDKDNLAALCYGTLIDILSDPKYTAELRREPVGLLTTDYLIRSARKDIESATTSELREKLLLGCAPFITDKRDVLIKLGIKLAPGVP